MKTSLYRLVSVSYVSRISLIALLLLLLGGWNTQAWAQLPYNTTMTQTHYNNSKIVVGNDGASYSQNKWDSGIRLEARKSYIRGTEWNWDDKYVIIALNQNSIPYQLKFKYKCSSNIATNPDWYVAESTSKSGPWTNVWSTSSKNTSWSGEQIVNLSKSTKYIKLCYSGNYAGTYGSIKVTDQAYVHNPMVGETEITSLDFGSGTISSGKAELSFDVEWCNVSTLSVSSNNTTYFTVSPASFGNTAQYSTQTVTVYYDRDVAVGNNHSGTITISNNNANYTKTVTVSGSTTLRPQAIHWNAGLAAVNYTLNAEDNLTGSAIATADNEDATITYTSSNSDVIAVSPDGKTLVAVANGTAKITATATGNDIYDDGTDSKTFTVTAKKKQTITWEQTLVGLKTNASPNTINLNATATSGGTVTYAIEAGSDACVTLSGANNSVMTITGTPGEAYIIATQAGGIIGGEEWISATARKQVKVRDPNSACDEYALADQSFTFNKGDKTSMSEKAFNLTGKPTTLTFYAKRGGLKYIWSEQQDMYVEQYANFGSGLEWKQVVSIKPGEDRGKFGPYTLDETATKIRFRSGEYAEQNVTNISVPRKKELEVSETDITENAERNVHWSKTISVSRSNIDVVDLSVTSSDASCPFVLNKTSIGTDCADRSTETFEVSFTPKEKNKTYTGTITITDGKANPTIRTINLSVTTVAFNQAITWNFEDNQVFETTHEPLVFDATTDATGLAVSYKLKDGDEDKATIEGNTLTFTASGKIHVIAYQEGSDRYNAAPEIEKTIIVNKATPDIATKPNGTAVTYLQNLSASTLSDGSADVTLRGVANSKVDGSFAWTNPSTRVEEAEGSHSYEVTFTPTDGGMYNNNTCQVAIQVNKADQAIEMNDGAVKVAVDGIDAGKADSKIDLDDLIASQTSDPVNNNRVGAVTYEVISDNKANAAIADGNIFSATAIGDYTIRATKAQTDYYNATTADFTVIVGKRGNTITTAGPYTKYVDEEVAEAATVVNSDGEIHTSSSDATIAYYDITNNKIVIPNSEAKSFDTKEVTIKIWQDETVRFEGIAEADAKTITLTVKKYDNAILVKGVANYVNTITTDSYDNGFVFTANNTDYENSPIIVTQTEGNEIATYYDTAENPKVVYSNSKLGTATWSVTQAESYKYKAAANTFTVKVENAAMGQCFMYNDQNEYKVSTHITSFQGEETDKWYIPDAQNAQELYYEAKKSLLASEQFFIQYSKNGTDWTDLDQPDLSNWGSYQTYGPIDVSNIDFVYLRATAKTWATGTKNIKNIRLTRKPNLLAEGISITKTADNQTLYFGNVGAGKVNVNWSVVDGGEIHVVSDNDKFTIPQDVIPNTECNSGTTPVTILYHPTSTKEESATITIYNTNQRVEVTVTGKAGKAPQTIVWYINGEAVDTRTNPKPAVRTTDIITARTNRNHEVTFTSVSNAELMEITANGTLIPLQEGEVTVYAHGAVDDEDRANYAEVNDQLTFVVTEAAIQTIVWDQTFLGLDQNIEDIPLTAYAKWTDENGNEQRREVTYTVADESVAQEVNGKLNILTPGTTIITATAPGGEENGITFLEAIATKKIVVRDPNADCDRLIYTQSEEKAADCGWNLTHKVDRSIIFDLSEYGEPRTCNFDYTGASHKDLVGVYYFYAGTVKVEQYLSTTNQWVEVETSLSSYSKGSKDGAKGTYVNSGNIQLDAYATKIQVSVYGAVGYFYVNNMQITLARYIEPDQETMELGEHSVGEVFKNEVPLEISYSNVAGPITITSSKPDLFYVAEENRMLDVECGAEGMKAVNVYYHPVSDSESDEAVLTISDGKMTKEVTLHASTADLRYIFNSENTTWEQNNNWVGKDAPTSGDYVVEIQTDVVLTSNVSVYSLTIDEGATLTIGNGGTLTIGEGNSIPKETYGNLHVAKGGKVRLTTGEVIVNDFYLDAELADLEHSGRSGQVHNTNQLVVNGDAYFDLALDPSGQCSPGWYDFTVPFPVDAVNGVTRFDNSTHLEKTIKCETNYAIMDFSESRRVETGYGWKKYHSVMQPGQCYTITIDDVDNVYRFKKTATGSFNLSSTTSMAFSDVENENKGWNCLGNGTLEHANLSAEGIEKVHIYSHTTNSYTAVPIDEYTYVVGSAYMIQTPSAGREITYTHVGNTRTLRAPRRSSSETEFMLSLSQEGANYSDDRLYVSADEEATYYYEAGRELTKFAAPTDSKVAQVWANAYGMKLCDVEAPLVDDEAAVVLSFYAPKAGSYTLAIDRMPEDEADLYLTYNGSDIWNLTESPYTLDLSKGTTEGYGLRIQSRNAPLITTGVDEINGEKEGNRKVLIGNDIYIITKEGAIFNATGKKVK